MDYREILSSAFIQNVMFLCDGIWMRAAFRRVSEESLSQKALKHNYACIHVHN